MRAWIRVTIVAALATLSLVAAQSASAFTEVGNNCTAETSTGVGPYTLVQYAKVPDPLPLNVPADGVVTKWRVNVATGALPVKEKLVVLDLVGPPAEYRAVGESSVEEAIGGQNIFEARIPVQAGDRFGLTGNVSICESETTENQVRYVEGEVPVGSTAAFQPAPIPGGSLLAVSAIVEPDADGDGYGDETQDHCPENASVQDDCPQPPLPPPPPPTVELDSFAVSQRGSVAVLVSVSSEAPVTVSGIAKLPKGKKANLKGGTQTVAPGRLARFTLKFTGPLKKALGELNSRRSLKLAIQATATDRAGHTTTDTTNLKLKGKA